MKGMVSNGCQWRELSQIEKINKYWTQQKSTYHQWRTHWWNWRLQKMRDRYYHSLLVWLCVQAMDSRHRLPVERTRRSQAYKQIRYNWTERSLKMSSLCLFRLKRQTLQSISKSNIFFNNNIKLQKLFVKFYDFSNYWLNSDQKSFEGKTWNQ